MKRLKKMMLALLVMTMFFTGVQINNEQKVNAESVDNAWKKSAITAPTEGSLIGAGYIDIKWANTLENVSAYKVYFDGAYKKDVTPTSEEVLSCEVYTTQVSAHKAYIVAVLKDGSQVQSDTRTFYVTKKGIGVNTKDMGAAVNPADLNLGWYYNWGTKSFKELNYKNKKFYDLDFTPMIWGNPTEQYTTIFKRANEQGYKYLLGFNEPDLTWESNIAADIAASRWRNYYVPNKGNLKLGSPAISTASPVVDSKWWDEYWNTLNASDKEETTIMAIHTYYENYNAETAREFLMLVDEAYNKYHKPIWITEFALYRFNKNSTEATKNQEFLKIVCKGLNERSYVERYAWFSPNLNPPANEKDASASALFDYATGELTTIGKMYAQIGNPQGYQAKTYNVDSSTSVDTSIAGCASALSTKVYNIVAKKKAFTYDIKETKRAAGYQVQYGQKKTMKGAKTKNVTKLTGKIKVTFTKAQKKKIKKGKLKKVNYYVRVRAYKNILGKTVYYKWTNVEAIKVKTK